MHDSASLSIVIPNARSFPAGLVAQLSAQLDDGDEIIVVRNNLPSDANRWVLDPAAATSGAPPERLGDEVIVEDAGSACGAARARNYGWGRSRRDWVFFLDDDVEVGLELLSLVRGAIRDARQAGIITFRVRSRCSEWSDLVAATISLDRGAEIRRTHDRSFRLRDAWMLGVGAAVLVRRDLLMGLGGFKDHLGAGLPNGGAEDLELLWHASRHSSLVYRGDISVLHTDVATLHELGAKFSQYGRAIAKLSAHEKSATGFLTVMDYCVHLICAVGAYLRRTPLPWRYRSELASAVARAVATTAASYVSSFVSSRHDDVLCRDCLRQ